MFSVSLPFFYSPVKNSVPLIIHSGLGTLTNRAHLYIPMTDTVGKLAMEELCYSETAGNRNTMHHVKHTSICMYSKNGEGMAASASVG